MISLWKQFHISSCRRQKYIMKSMEIFAFFTICVAIARISNAHPATSIRGQCDAKNSCDQEMVCVNNKCFNIDAIASAYGPVKGSTDGGWCNSSKPCGQDQLCVNSECIDRNRNWGSDNSKENNVESFDVRIKPSGIDVTPTSRNFMIESTSVKPPVGQDERSNEWVWN